MASVKPATQTETTSICTITFKEDINTSLGTLRGVCERNAKNVSPYSKLEEEPKVERN